MKRTEIDALVRAHRGRARPVAFLHLLRQSALEEDDLAFLREHARELAVPDLLAWRARCAAGFTGAVIRELARIAVEEPSCFEHELLNAPGFSLADEEWIELAELVRAKVPASLYERILARGDRSSSPPTLESTRNEATRNEREDLASFLDTAFAELEPIDEARPPAPDDKGPLSADMAPELILERAQNAFSPDERITLLEWLSKKGMARRPLMEIALLAVRAGELGARQRSWLAEQMSSRAAWEAHGVDLFLAFLDREAFSELSELAALVWSNARQAPAQRGLLEAMQAALAAALLSQTRESIAVGEHARSLAALSAFACLDPPSRLSRAIRDLLNMPGVEGDVRVLLELNARFVKHGKARDASFEGVVAAIHSFADARAEHN